MNQSKKTIIPVILSGGSGTRLWPLSREASPKPFISLPDGESLLVKAFRRAALPSISDILVVTREELYFRTKDHFEESAVSGINVTYLLEPFGRNTAAAIKFATLYAKNKFGGDTILLFLSADHLIANPEGFANSVKNAVLLAQEGYLVTFGVPPSYPETGYGYIELGKEIVSTKGNLVAQFTEKPDLATAEDFIRSGSFLWNAGIFCFKADSFLDEARIIAPELLTKVEDVLIASNLNISPVTLDEKTFALVPSISIDFAILEHSKKVAVVPAEFDWKDIGSWKSMSLLTPENEQTNRTLGEVFTVDTKGTYINSTHRLTATIGVEDLIIVDTPDALLVAHKDRHEDVKKIAEHLKREGHESYLSHRTVHRPWGTYTILEEGNGFKIKRITVKPGASLSLQSHKNRSEHWVIVNGIAKIVNGEQELFLNTNEGAFVKAGNKHRLSNPGEDTLVMIETQVGGYLGEDDIIRYDDTYGRV